MDCKIHFNAQAYLKSFLGGLGRQVDNASNNLASKDIKGYVKTYINLSINNIGGVSAGVSASNPIPSVNERLVDSIRQSHSRYAKFSSCDDYFKRVELFFGLGGEQSAFIHSGELMVDAIRKAESHPILANKKEAIFTIDNHLRDLNKISDGIQSIRSYVDQDMNDAVLNINSLINDIAKYNLAIGAHVDNDLEKLSLINSRRQALQELSELIGIKVKPFGDDQVKVLTESNQTLVQGEIAANIEYTPANVVDANTTFAPLTLKGLGSDVDLTISLSKTGSNGKIAAMCQLRDSFLKGLQQQLDNYAFELKESFNAIHNRGTAINPPNEMIGHVGIPGITGPITDTTTINGAGTLRIGVFDPSTSKIKNSTNIDLSTINTVGELMNAINNNVSGLNASITPIGQLKITTALPNGIAMGNVGDAEAKLSFGSSYDATKAFGFSNFFGLNNIIESKGVLPGNNIGGLAGILRIRDDILSSDGSVLSAGELSRNSTLPSLDTPSRNDLGEKDTTILKNLADHYLLEKVDFVSTVTSNLQHNSLQGYATNIVSSHTQTVKSNAGLLKNEKFTYDGLSADAFRISGVDQEETIQQFYDLALSKRIGLNAMGVLKQMSNDIAQLLLR
jgi:flagellar hook-associated protein 1 FlgK